MTTCPVCGGKMMTSRDVRVDYEQGEVCNLPAGLNVAFRAQCLLGCWMSRWLTTPELADAYLAAFAKLSTTVGTAPGV